MTSERYSSVCHDKETNRITLPTSAEKTQWKSQLRLVLTKKCAPLAAVPAMPSLMNRGPPPLVLKLFSVLGWSGMYSAA
jgi:hypothetical protein